MILTKKLLIQWNACQDGIDFCERNNLFGFDLSKIDEINGDYRQFIGWLKTEYLIKREYDFNINCIKEYHDNFFITSEYDQNNNKIKEEYSNGKWTKYEYDEHGNKIKEEYSNGYWKKWTYDKHNNKLSSNDYNTKLEWTYDHHGNKLSQSRNGILEFIWTYDQNNNFISISNSNGLLQLYEYDKHKNIIKQTNPVTNETFLTHTQYYNNGQLKKIDQLILPLI